jgi:hypothetical protein
MAPFNASDPYIHNKQFGIAHFKLSDKTFTYKPIGPAPYQMAGMQVSPDQAGLHRGDRGHDRQQALRVLKLT